MTNVLLTTNNFRHWSCDAWLIFDASGHHCITHNTNSFKCSLKINLYQINLYAVSVRRDAFMLYGTELSSTITPFSRDASIRDKG